MTGPEDTDARRALRSVLADRIGALTPPTQVYESVRRRPRRGRRAMVGGTALAAVAAVAVPTVVLRDRDAGARPAVTATAPASADVPVGGEPYCHPGQSATGPTPAFPTRTGVRGSLGGDPAAVAAVLKAAWPQLAGSPGAVPAQARVRSIERTDGVVVGTVTVTDAGAHNMSQATASGPDIAHLHGEGGEGGSSGLGIPDPIRTTFYGSEVYTAVVTVDCRSAVSVVGPPGSVAVVNWIDGIAADGTVEKRAMSLSRPDGVGLVPLPPDVIAVSVQVAKDGHNLAKKDLYLPGQSPAPQDVGRAVGRAPGPGNKLIADGLLDSGNAQARWPRSGLRVLWVGEHKTDTVTAAVLTQPSGALAVWGGVSRSESSIPGGARAFAGLLPAGTLDRTGLVYRMPLPGHPIAVFVSGTRTVTVERGGASTAVRVTGGTIIPDGDSVTSVSVGSMPAIDVTTLTRPPGLFVVKGI